MASPVALYMAVNTLKAKWKFEVWGLKEFPCIISMHCSLMRRIFLMRMHINNVILKTGMNACDSEALFQDHCDYIYP